MVRETRPPPRPRCPGRRGSPASTAHRRRRAHLQRGVAEAYGEEEVPQSCSWDDLFALHRANETAPKRVVGLVVETRPDLVTAEACRTLRTLGLHQGADRHPKPERRDARRQRPRHHVRAYRRRHGPAAAVRLQKPRALHGEPARAPTPSPTLPTTVVSSPTRVSARRGEALPCCLVESARSPTISKTAAGAPTPRKSSWKSSSRTCWPPRPGPASPA